MDDLDYFRFLLALLLVVGLIGLFAFLLKRLGLGSIRAPTLGKRHRLSIQEVAAIDARHKLVLVRRDDRDHLILLGSTADLLVESGIPAPEYDKTVTASSADEGGSRFKHLVDTMRNKSS